MLSYNAGTQQWSNDQRVVARAKVWDTATSVPHKGVGYASFSLLSPNNFSLAGLSKSAVETTLNGGTVKSVLGYAGGTYRTGVIPNVYQYWGSGAPIGVTTASRAVQKYFGTVQETGTTTLVFGGQGYVSVFIDGVLLTEGTLREPEARPALESGSGLGIVESEAGYVIKADVALTAGQLVEIYYVHNGERWGGLFAKAIAGDVPHTTWKDFRVALRDAAVVGSSLISIAGTEKVGDEIPYLISANVDVNKGTVATATFEVSLSRSDLPTGFRLVNTEDQYHLEDNVGGVPLQLKPHQRVQFEGGYAGPGGTEDVYPRFTGHIADIYPSSSGETATVECVGIADKLKEQYIENFPDLLSYHANAFLQREWKGEPVWGIPAFDAWPLETVLADIYSRAGIDSYNLGKSPFTGDPSFGRMEHTTTTSLSKVTGARLFSARAMLNVNEKIYLQRNKNYGNYGVLKKDYLPFDSEYLFAPEITDELLDGVKELVENYGYDFGFDGLGQGYIAARNNPTAFDYEGVLQTAGKEQVSPEAVGGRYFVQKKSSLGTFTKVVEGYFSRLDLFTGIGEDPSTGLNGGRLDVVVERHNGTIWEEVVSENKVISTYAEGLTEAFFYTNILREDGTNASTFSLVNLPFDRYRVTITPAGTDLKDVNVDCLYRLDGVATYQKNPLASSYPGEFSTSGNVFSMNPTSDRRDLRNLVIVVGARQATVTDSAKFEEQNNTNMSKEHFLSVAADAGSIFDPTSPNFVGVKKVFLIVDASIADGNYASWLAQSTLYKYRTPQNSAEIRHTAVPIMELGDPIHAVEEKHSSLNDLLWVEGFRETWTADKAEVQIRTSSYLQSPSYVPREDIPIDELFVPEGEDLGTPVTNVKLSYKNLYGQEVGNSVLTAPTLVEPTKTSVVAAAVSQALPAYTIPESVLLLENSGKRVLVNHPYRHFWDITSWTGYGPTLTYDFQEGDGTPGVYDETYYSFPADYTVQHKVLTAGRTTAENPFYDPYTSELGNLMEISFDALVGGFYRVSVWAADKGHDPIPLAWLTELSGDPLEPEAHWSYSDPGKHTFLFDGADNIGEWNRRMSQNFAAATEGAFGEEPTAVTTGFYAWNDLTSFTQVGDPLVENYGSDAPYFTVGGYSKFYIRIDVSSDRLMRETLDRIPRTVESDSLPIKAGVPGATGASLTTINDVGETYLWLHLGEPTQVEIRAKDYVGNDWNRLVATTGLDWTKLAADNSDGSDPDEAVITNTKPIKFTFLSVPRRGIMFENKEDKLSVKLIRQAHLKATLLDTFLTRFGKPWDELEDVSTSEEEKRITNRMYHVDEHTTEIKDESWRTGKDLATLEWIFIPEYFEKDFGGGFVESLQFGDFEQLSTIPGLNLKQLSLSTEEQAYFILGFINYLFYFQAYTLDRSGRRQWCLNREFIDRSKIVSPDWLAATPVEGTRHKYAVGYERNGSDKYLARSIFVRQWVEDYWDDSLDIRSPANKYGIVGTGLNWVQPRLKDFDPQSGLLDTGISDQWIAAYQTSASRANKDMRGKLGSTQPTFYPTTLANTWALQGSAAASQLGSWNFDRGGFPDLFWPSPKRDFHPYWRIPQMPDWGWNDTEDYYALHVLACPVSNWQFKARDIAARERWYGVHFGEATTMPKGARLELPARNWLPNNEDNKGQTDNWKLVYDYERVDELERFDVFRGVWSRAPWPNRDEADTAYDDRAGTRSTNQQMITPSGAYLLNVGNYTDYTTAPQFKGKEQIVHFAEHCGSMFDVRFRHEFVWYSNRYFPVNATEFRHGPLYMLFREEFTGARELLFRKVPEVRYDAGAWTGWKDDAKRKIGTYTERVECEHWNNDAFLRWRDNDVHHLKRIDHSEEPKLYGGVFMPFLSGGFGETLSTSWGASGEEQRTQQWMNQQYWYVRANILDEGMATELSSINMDTYDMYGYPTGKHRKRHFTNRMRLAVGPRVPETRSIRMNLVTPARLTGDNTLL